MILTKYSASGNDFLIFHTFKSGDYSALARELCDRHNGIGADGLVVVLPHSQNHKNSQDSAKSSQDSSQIAYEWDFYNADGSRAKMCGNASRSVGHYAYHSGLADAKHSFLSGAGEIKVCVEPNNVVEVNFGSAKILEQNIMAENLNFTLIECGVPHLVAFCEILTPNLELMQTLRHKHNANVNLACIKDSCTIEIETYERGVEDITLACGTGMASAFYLANHLGFIRDSAILVPPSGDRLAFRIQNDEIYYKGAVKKIAQIIV